MLIFQTKLSFLKARASIHRFKTEVFVMRILLIISETRSTKYYLIYLIKKVAGHLLHTCVSEIRKKHGYAPCK